MSADTTILSWAQFNTIYAQEHPGATMLDFVGAWEVYQLAHPKKKRAKKGEGKVRKPRAKK